MASTTTGVSRAPSTTGPRDPDRLHRDAVAVWRLLSDLDEHEHRVRAQLLAARDAIRAEAATQWRDHGWRSITDER